MNQSYIFYLCTGGMLFAAVSSLLNFTNLMYLGIGIMMLGAMLIPQLDKANKNARGYPNEKVIDVEIVEPRKHKYIND